MIRPIVTARLMLRQPSEPATSTDAQIGQDLLDTLAANVERCHGMAANMIGERKRILVYWDEAAGGGKLMYNPEILERGGEYRVEEGCLSLPGFREATRYQRIRVRYQDEGFAWRERSVKGLVAETIQHEMDHFEGILI